MTDDNEERRLQQIHQASANADSRGFFAGRKARIVLTADDEVLPPANDADARQAIRRQERLTQTFQQALTTRVSDPGGDRFMKVTWTELERLRTDPAYRSLATYMNHLLCYVDISGTPMLDKPRAKPIRPLVKDEMGMYKDKIVVLINNPGDQYVGTLHPVGVQLEAPKPVQTPVTPGPVPEYAPSGECEIVDVDGDE